MLALFSIAGLMTSDLKQGVSSKELPVYARRKAIADYFMFLWNYDFRFLLVNLGAFPRLGCFISLITSKHSRTQTSHM